MSAVSAKPILLAALLLATAFPAQAAGKKVPFHHPSFKLLDANHDGKLSKDEYKQAGEVDLAFAKGGPKLFALIDTNHDGTLSEAEYKAWLAQQR